MSTDTQAPGGAAADDQGSLRARRALISLLPVVGLGWLSACSERTQTPNAPTPTTGSGTGSTTGSSPTSGTAAGPGMTAGGSGSAGNTTGGNAPGGGTTAAGANETGGGARSGNTGSPSMPGSTGNTPTTPTAAGPAAALPLVNPSDPQAQALGYVAQASQADKSRFPKYTAGQSCASCSLYGGPPTQPQAPCPLFAGRNVAAPAWCSAWVARA